MHVYPNLKLQIWRMGLRQNRLAQILDVDETQLSRIVNGFREPNAALRARIAAALRADEAWLFQRVSLGPAENTAPAVARKTAGSRAPD